MLAAVMPILLLLGIANSLGVFALRICTQHQNTTQISGDNHHDWRPTMSYPEMALDVVETLDRLAIDGQVVLVGHSIGGKVAQAVALLHPHRIAGLVILDMAPVVYDPDKDPSWKAVMEIIQVLNSIVVIPGQTTKRSVDALLQKSIPDPALRAFVMTNFDPNQHPRGGWKVNLQSVSDSLDTLAGFGNNDEHDLLAGRRWEGDALFINGGQSRFVRHAHMESIANYFPNHMLTTIRGVGHWVHAEAPDDTLALLKRYLDR